MNPHERGPVDATAVTFHPTSIPPLACDLCGCVVDASDRGRTLHQRWHNEAGQVIDLTAKLEQRIEAASSDG
jgi:hypothetical protein